MKALDSGTIFSYSSMDVFLTESAPRTPARFLLCLGAAIDSPQLCQLQRKLNQAAHVTELIWPPVRRLTEVRVPVGPEQTD